MVEAGKEGHGNTRFGIAEPLRLRGGIIFCEKGTVWLTIEGDREDYVIRSGEAKRLPDSVLSVCEALSDDTVAWVRGQALGTP